MKASASVATFLAKAEGCRNCVYNDQRGLPTIGIGHLLSRSELSSGRITINGMSIDYRKTGLTDVQCGALLLQDIQPAERTVNSLVEVELNQDQFDALVLFVFNVGMAAFAGSTLLHLLNKGKYDQAPGQMMKWVYVGHVESDGLRKRREAEVVVWNGRE